MAPKTKQGYDSFIHGTADAIEDDVGDDGRDYILDAVWEDADYYVEGMDADEAINVLQFGENDPEDWHSIAGDTDDYRHVLRVMAVRVVEMDLKDELLERGALE